MEGQEPEVGAWREGGSKEGREEGKKKERRQSMADWCWRVPPTSMAEGSLCNKCSSFGLGQLEWLCLAVVRIFSLGVSLVN